MFVQRLAVGDEGHECKDSGRKKGNVDDGCKEGLMVGMVQVERFLRKSLVSSHGYIV